MPRQIIPKDIYLITRRCTQREVLLQPTALTFQIFAFCLAWIAGRVGIEVYAVCVLGNHYHAVVRDPFGRLPKLLEDLHKYVAKCINASLGRWENLWAAEQPSAVRLVDAPDVLDKMVYTLANPVSSFLVPCGDMWPGLRLGGEAWGQSLQVERPEVFFRPDGDVPRTVELTLQRPPIFPELDDAELAGLLAGAVEEREAKHRREARHRGIRFLCQRKTGKGEHWSKPTSREARRGLRPRVASKDRWRRLEALRRLRAFVEAYREAYRRWRAGARDVVFPEGTYALRIHAGVTCGPIG